MTRSLSAALVLAVVLALVSAFFLAQPQIDLAAAGRFYTPGEGFTLKGAPLPRAARDGARLLELAYGLFLLVALASAFVRPERPLLAPHKSLFAISSALLAPWIIVNLVFKAHSGRARPHQTDLFGGDGAFTPAWVFTDQCASNCSFVSGEVASAAWLFTAAVIAPRPYRAPIAVLAALLTLAVAMSRMAYGGHYLSDTVISATITGLVIALMAHIFLERFPRATDERVAGAAWRAARLLSRRSRGEKA